MLTSIYAEDVFSRLYDLIRKNKVVVQHQDLSPVVSFATKIIDGSQLTKNQANYILKLLEKYKNLAAAAGFDYRSDLQSLQWKNTFRTLDLTKRAYVEKSQNGNIEVCLKFPYQLKNEFDDEILKKTNEATTRNRWDQEEKVRRLNLYDFNLIALYEFAVKHNFEIDESFMTVLADVEEIWQNNESIIPRACIVDNSVMLINATEETQTYFDQNKTGSLIADALLAKSMGYLFTEIENFPLKKLVSSAENSFWIKENKTFFDLYKELQGRVCIVLDRSSNTLAWLQKFVSDADKNSVSREEIKVCFRESKDDRSGLNDWIRTAGVGGKVENGKILIFESKPAKWLFKEQEDVKILVTNNIYPPTNNLAREWFQSHPCVIYLGETKPTEQRGQKIVEL